MADISQFELAIAGGLLTIAGTLLNATMTATFNMASIVDNTPAVGLAWTTIRNFASIFIIFMLLFASIKMILGLGSGEAKLIKNIVIAGLLINFSLFFTKLAVDASNIISLSFYTAIAPTALGQTGSSVNASNSAAGSFVNLLSTAFDDGGLSNVFMQSLDLQGFANSSPPTGPSPEITQENIALANSGGAVLMAFAAVSFLAAAIAFAVRIGVLVMLMAFSPIFFVAMVFPDLSKYSKKWSGMLYAMCIFMPVYLLLMYVAMKVINDPHFFCFAQTTVSAACRAAGANATNVTGGLIGALIGPHTIGTVLQYIIAIFLINAPLLAAISIAGEGADFMSKMMKSVSKWGQGVIGPSTMAQHQIGRGARAISESKAFGAFAKRNPNLALLADSGLKKVSSASFGGTKGGFDKRVEDHTKALVKLGEKAKPTASTSRLYAKQSMDLETKKVGWEDQLNLVRGGLADPGLTDEQRRDYKAMELNAQMELAKINSEIDKRHKSSLTPEGYKKELEKTAQEEFAKNIMSNKNILTKEARASAAKKIRDEIKKDPSEKALEKILKEAIKKESGGDTKENTKPKEDEK
jgi:hypothetical protein